MHASSYENMSKCYRRYIRPSPLHQRDCTIVLDVGGADVNGGYKPLFSRSNQRYTTADINSGAGVDIVLKDPYHLPLADATVDIVLSGQMLEHCEFFWLAFAEMVRVLKPDGFLFLIAPSSGPIHQYPVDCYRFYPDAYAALAKYANCHLVESWLDERGPWCDLVGVFSKQPRPAPPLLTPFPMEEEHPDDWFDPVNSEPGSAGEEAIQGKLHYLDVLQELHRALEPSSYLELGVRHGKSLVLAQCHAIGVDPRPEIQITLPADTTQIIDKTSDDFFDTLSRSDDSNPGRADLVFIDGMHHFEYVLRDFMNVERHAKPGAVAVIDDIYPNHPAQAERKRRTRVWTGDVWKLHRLLAELRPDLFILPLDTEPTGLLLITCLDPGNRVFWNNYNPIIRQYAVSMPVPADVLARKNATNPSREGLHVICEQIREARKSGLSLHKSQLQRHLAPVA
jgi:SAM-dependent methyltransferase